MTDRAGEYQRLAQNATKRERIAKVTCQYYLDELQKANLVNAELAEKLDSYKRKFIQFIS